MHNTQADKHKKVNLLAELFLDGQHHLGSVGHEPASSLIKRLRHAVSCHRSSRHCQGWAQARTQTHVHAQGYLFFQRGCNRAAAGERSHLHTSPYKAKHSTAHPVLPTKPWSFKWSAARINYAYNSVPHISFPPLSHSLFFLFSRCKICNKINDIIWLYFWTTNAKIHTSK